MRLQHDWLTWSCREMMVLLCGQDPQLLDICTSVAEEMSRKSSPSDTRPDTSCKSSSSSVPTRGNTFGASYETLNKLTASLGSEKSLTTSPRGSVPSASRSYLTPGTWCPRGSQSGSSASTRRLSDSTINSVASSLWGSSIS